MTSTSPPTLTLPADLPTWNFNDMRAAVAARDATSPSERAPRISRQSTLERRRSSLLGGLKSKFSRKSAVEPAADEHPLRPTAPATRRPDRPRMNAFTVPSNEPPPAYTPRADASVGAVAPVVATDSPAAENPVAQPQTMATTTASTDDDAYEFLSSFDTIFLIDDSGSMAGRSWRECTAVLEAITPICTSHDADGIDLYFLNAPDTPHYRNVTDASTVHEIFSTVRPQGGTPTGQKLNKILRNHLRQLEAAPMDTKPINIIVITDGAPADDVESVLISAAQKLDRLDAEPWQIGVQFFQVGEEEGAREHLAGLDDELSRMGGGCRDIVDTVPFVPGARGRGLGLSADGILKVVLGAVNKRLDRRRNSGEQQRQPQQ